MGLFDSVMVSCPNCGEEQEFQSKGGECMLRCFTLADCPVDVLSDVNRHAPYDCDCGTSYLVDIDNRTAETIERNK